MAVKAGYEALAEAIVVQAGRDYKEEKALRPEVESFLLSEWCNKLVGHSTSGEYILRKLKEAC